MKRLGVTDADFADPRDRWLKGLQAGSCRSVSQTATGTAKMVFLEAETGMNRNSLSLNEKTLDAVGPGCSNIARTRMGGTASVRGSLPPSQPTIAERPKK